VAVGGGCRGDVLVRRDRGNVHEHAVEGVGGLADDGLEAFGRVGGLRARELGEGRVRRADRDAARGLDARGVGERAVEVDERVARRDVLVGEQLGRVHVDATGHVLREALRGERGVEHGDVATGSCENGSGLDDESGRAGAAGGADERDRAWRTHTSRCVAFDYK